MKYQLEINYFLYLLKCAVADIVPKPAEKEINWEVVYKFAKLHKVTSTLYFSISKLPDDYKSSITHLEEYSLDYKKNIVLDVNRAYELERIEKTLAENNIDYIFLKGSVSKKFYIDSSMRPMNDIDILFRGADLKEVTKLFEAMGYGIAHSSAKDICCINKSNHLLVEMQTHLIDEGYTLWYNYLEKIWGHCSSLPDKPNQYLMTKEDFYIYHVIHMAKHFLNGGIGIKHFLDLYIMNKNKYIESAKVDSCLEVLGILQFKNTIENLCLYWFDGVNNFDNHKDVQLLTKYIFLGGAFGNSQNQEAGSLAKSGKKKTSLAAKLFPSMDTMINFYGSFLKNHKWLLPLYWLRLNIERLLRFDKKSKAKLKIIKSLSDEDIKNTKEVFTICGLI